MQPKVFIIGESRINEVGLQSYLDHVEAKDWRTDATSGAEKLAEFYGRLCYRSFKPGMNANVTKVREGNGPYLANILASAHGSVLEHSTVNFVFADVSRVFTHELVRHRVGTAISQESLRYVRLEDMDPWVPTVVKEDAGVMAIYMATFAQLSELQAILADKFKLDDPEAKFHHKKLATSAMRRLAPEGLATTIGWTANLRTIRSVIEQRTDPSAEEEIRLVFAEVASLMVKRYPAVFGDYTVEVVEGYPHYKTKHPGV